MDAKSTISPAQIRDAIRQAQMCETTRKELARRLGAEPLLEAWREHFDLPPFDEGEAEASPRGNYIRWTLEEDAAILKAIANGLTARECAAGMNRTYHAVKHRRKRLGPDVPLFRDPRTPVQWTSDKIAILREMRRQRISYAACGKHFGVTRSTISGAVMRHLKPKGNQNHDHPMSSVRLQRQSQGTHGGPENQPRQAQADRSEAVAPAGRIAVCAE